jgi:hypothetical protein
MTNPEWATFIKDIATTIGIFVGGGWTIWKWSISEWLRRRKEIPSLDSKIKSTTVIASGDHALVSFEFLWRNRGQLTVPIDSKRSVCQVFELPQSVRVGPLSDQVTQLTPQFEDFFLKRLKEYTLEPNTERTIQCQFVLPSKTVYVVRITLIQHCKNPGDADFWQREFVWSN